MDREMLKIAGAVAGVVGVSTTLVIIIFKEIIRKNIFPRLTKLHAYRILLWIIILSFAIGCFGIYAWLLKSDSKNLQYTTKLTIYLDSIPWRLTSVEIPERKFLSTTNKVGEVEIPLEENGTQAEKLLIGGRFTVAEVFQKELREKSIYLESPRFKESEIAGVIFKNGKPETDVKIVTEHGDSTRTNNIGRFAMTIKSKIHQDRITVTYSKGDNVKRAIIQVDQTSLSLDL